METTTMTTNKECDTKHNNVNSVIKIIFTILFGACSFFGGFGAYVLANQNSNAKEVQTCKVDLEILKASCELQHKLILEQFIEIKKELAGIKSELAEINKKLVELDKRLSLHEGKDNGQK